MKFHDAHQIIQEKKNLQHLKNGSGKLFKAQSSRFCEKIDWGCQDVH